MSAGSTTQWQPCFEQRAIRKATRDVPDCVRTGLPYPFRSRVASNAHKLELYILCCEIVEYYMEHSRPECEVEINHLVDLTEDLPNESVEVRRKKAVVSCALREWKESLEVVDAKVSRRTKRVDCLTNEIYQLVGLYGVFVGVVFSAVVSDRVRCEHIWIPAVLCMLPCVVIIYFIDKRLSYVREIRKEKADDENSRKALLSCIAQLKSNGYERFNFSEHAKERVWQHSETGAFKTRRYVIAALVLTLIVFGCAFVHILCLTKYPGCEAPVSWNDYSPGHNLLLY